MNHIDRKILNIDTIKEIHSLMGLPGPLNPLITIINHSQTKETYLPVQQKLLMNFYNITIKKSFKGKLKYGKNHYDFDEGIMSFVAPKQIIYIDDIEERNTEGWSLLFNPDLIRKYPLGKTIKHYGFFSYAVNEALHLSSLEEKTIENIVQNIQNEINSRLDNFSQDVIVSNLELLLNYCNRFYNRQFISRKMASNDLLIRFEKILEDHFYINAVPKLPTVQNIASSLNVSPPYLSDMLRSVTGQNSQQHIHNKIVEKAKEILATTDLSVSEIAYSLGFEYSQSFSKLFKNKMNISPGEYRNQFN
ncbi:helix-turn-helix domain-containing protein [Mucilaginibacter gossypii]|nr:helix-turn-helix transcriptional regulator [Mucilaginibacter gossypii]